MICRVVILLVTDVLKYADFLLVSLCRGHWSRRKHSGIRKSYPLPLKEEVEKTINKTMYLNQPHYQSHLASYQLEATYLLSTAVFSSTGLDGYQEFISSI